MWWFLFSCPTQFACTFIGCLYITWWSWNCFFCQNTYVHLSYSGGRVSNSLVVCVVFVDHGLSIYPFSFVHCPSLMHVFLITLWYSNFTYIEYSNTKSHIESWIIGVRSYLYLHSAQCLNLKIYARESKFCTFCKFCDVFSLTTGNSDLTTKVYFVC